MFLAIRGNINNVYKLSNDESKLVEPYLKGISHKRFPQSKLEEACKWVKIKLIKEYPKFTQLENKLRELGYISETETIMDTNKKKNKYAKIYAMGEPKNVKMPGEIDFKDIDPSKCTNCRGYLLSYIFAGGNYVAHGEFKGKVLKIEENKGILFKRIYIDFVNCAEWETGKEDHVWIFDCEEFLKMGIKVGECVSFNALGYVYKRQNGTIDFGLKSPQWIKRIPEYELPTDEELLMHELEKIVCETCMFSEHCNGFCIAAQGYKEEMIAHLLEINKQMNKEE